MKTVLIVEDDASALRALARLIAARHGGVEVLTASNGREALELLKTRRADLVLTDLQMPELNGFDLLTWIMSNAPRTKVVPMTAFLCAETNHRLLSIGSIECLTKPVDLGVLSQLLNGVLTSGVQGYVQNIGLSSLLQLLELEQKTCVMGVIGEEGSGVIHLVNGRLVHAETRGLVGDEAALEMATWSDLKMSLEDRQTSSEPTVTHPLGYILMEGARLQDERRRKDSKKLAMEESGFFRAIGIRLDEAGEEGEVRDLSRRALESVASVEGVVGVALVDHEGRVSDQVGDCPSDELQPLARGAWLVLKAEVAALEDLRASEVVEEILLTETRRCELVRPLPAVDAFIFVVMDRERAVPAILRMKVSAIAVQLGQILRSRKPGESIKESSLVL